MRSRHRGGGKAVGIALGLVSLLGIAPAAAQGSTQVTVSARILAHCATATAPRQTGDAAARVRCSRGAPRPAVESRVVATVSDAPGLRKVAEERSRPGGAVVKVVTVLF